MDKKKYTAALELARFACKEPTPLCTFSCWRISVETEEDFQASVDS